MEKSSNGFENLSLRIFRNSWKSPWEPWTSENLYPFESLGISRSLSEYEYESTQFFVQSDLKMTPKMMMMMKRGIKT